MLNSRAQQLYSLTHGGSGGGSSKDLAEMTFMNAGEVIFQRPVYIGDDCPDPVGQTRIATPTKESTETTVYTHNGWATTDGGSADKKALLNITANKTVYAAFKETVRTYTVRIYNEGTLISTQQVAYGESATLPEVSKEGYKFNGCEPSHENITQDTDCHIQWILDDGVIRDDWDVIAARAQDGTAANYYKIGDIKKLSVAYEDGTAEEIPMRLVHFNPTLDDYLTGLYGSGDDHANVVFLADNLLSVKQKYASSSYYSLFKDSALYSYLNATFINYLPAALTANLLSVYETQGFSSLSAENGLKGKIWVPNRKELDGTGFTDTTSNDYYNNNGQKYDGVENSNAGRICTMLNGTTSTYYVRDTFMKSTVATGNACGVAADGSINSYNQATGTTAMGVRIGFCL